MRYNKYIQGLSRYRAEAGIREYEVIHLKRGISILIAALLLMACLSACGGEGQDTPATDTPPAQTQGDVLAQPPALDGAATAYILRDGRAAAGFGWRYDITDAYWSDMALHDSFLMPAEGKTGADFIALSFTCSPAEGGEPLWTVEPGEEAVVVLMRGEDGWEHMNWTQA